MTLDEAIDHAEWCADNSCGECADEHAQLADWLGELKLLRVENVRLRKECTRLRKSWEREFAASCEAATNNMVQTGTLKDENARLRELVRDMWLMEDIHLCEHCPVVEYGCVSCDCVELPRRMRELGVEVD